MGTVGEIKKKVAREPRESWDPARAKCLSNLLQVCVRLRVVNATLTMLRATIQ